MRRNEERESMKKSKKNLYFIFILLFILIISLISVSAKNQDNTNKIIGTWAFVEPIIESDNKMVENCLIEDFYGSGLQYNYLIFEEGGVYRVIEGLLYDASPPAKYSYHDNLLLLDGTVKLKTIINEDFLIIEHEPSYFSQEYIIRVIKTNCGTHNNIDLSSLKLNKIAYKLKREKEKLNYREMILE